jgi:putative membrane protein
MTYLLLRWIINIVGLYIVVVLVPGFHSSSWATLAVAALVLGLLNALVRPILFVLTLPLTIVTLGLFLIVLNAIVLELTDWLVTGFHIDSFLSACIGAIVLGVISLVTNRIGRERES